MAPCYQKDRWAREMTRETETGRWRGNQDKTNETTGNRGEGYRTREKIQGVIPISAKTIQERNQRRKRTAEKRNRKASAENRLATKSAKQKWNADNESNRYGSNDDTIPQREQAACTIQCNNE